jgi:hypothetical protein
MIAIDAEYIVKSKYILRNYRKRKYTALNSGSPIVKIQSKGKAIIKIGNLAREGGKLIFKPSPVVLDGVEVLRIGRK